MKSIFQSSKQELAKQIRGEDLRFYEILSCSQNLQECREGLFEYLNYLEGKYFDALPSGQFSGLHIISKNNAKECIRVMKNILRPENEELSGFSSLEILRSLSMGASIPEFISEGFLSEFIYLLRGINGKSNLLPEVSHADENPDQASARRSARLDSYSRKMLEQFKDFKSGLSPEMNKKSLRMKRKILRYFNAGEKNWKDYRWHLEHIIRDSVTVSALVGLSPEELEGIKLAEESHIPFHITPYYLSLFNETGRIREDRAIRAQVLPSLHYCTEVQKKRNGRVDMDFMGEKSTSPIKCITRRYPSIVVLKPFNSCPQICVYCQRNWEIENLSEARVAAEDVRKAVEWIRDNEHITEVLLTGGDPLTLPNSYIDSLLEQLSGIRHIERIRIGTRVLATLPFRIDSDFVSIMKKYNKLGSREICMVTHFEHFSEMTPSSLSAIKRIKKAGISIYNQQVFTYYNSLKYQSCMLRRVLKLSGIDPYYSFNTKGKEETDEFRVPIARIEQERKEEARFLPGLIRTDEPVFNVPRLGKSHLRSWQNHEPIMIMPGGQRVYRFYPWESKVSLADDYLYRDVSIYDYLKRLSSDGENISDYDSIWYYF